LSVAVINFTIALMAGLYALKKKDALAFLTGLYIYITFHYTYAALPIFFRDTFIVWRESTQPGAKLSGLIFIVFIIFEIYRRFVISNRRWMKQTALVLPVVLMLAWLLLTLAQWGLDMKAGQAISRVALQDTVSAILMLLLVMGFAVGLDVREAELVNFWHAARLFYPSILIVVTAVAFYQIIFAQDFASSPLPNGEMVLRACSFLFNPNVLGFWGALGIFFVSYGYHCGQFSLKFMLGAILLCGGSLFLSGSRSGLIIGVVLLMAPVIFLFIARKFERIGNSVLPAVFLSSVSLVVLVFIKVTDWITGRGIAALHDMSLIVDRFLSIPALVLNYAAKVVDRLFPGTGILFMDLIPEPKSHAMTNEYAQHIQRLPEAHDIYLNIEQRLTSSAGIADNGFIAIFEAGKWLGIIPWCLMWVAILWLGVRAFYRRPDVHSSYAVSAILGCIISAFAMRLFQVFPFWIMVALCLGPAIALILSTNSGHSVKPTNH